MGLYTLYTRIYFFIRWRRRRRKKTLFELMPALLLCEFWIFQRPLQLKFT